MYVLQNKAQRSETFCVKFEQGVSCLAVLAKYKKACVKINWNQSIEMPEKRLVLQY